MLLSISEYGIKLLNIRDIGHDIITYQLNEFGSIYLRDGGTGRIVAGDGIKMEGI